MRYFQDGRRIARMRGTDTFSAQIWNYARGEWVGNDQIGAEVRFTGNFEAITESDAMRQIQQPISA